MASHKRHSEGIALLSIYGDDEDDEMEDAEESPLADYNRVTPQTLVASQNAEIEGAGVSGSYADETALSIEEDRLVENVEFSLKATNSGPSPSLRVSQVIASISETNSSRNGRLAIVDYAHDEMALSPEREDGEILATGRVTYGEELQIATGEFPERASPHTVQGPSPNMRVSPPQSSDQNDLQEPNATVVESGPVETLEDIILTSEEAKEVDPLANFLPPLPKEKCSEELQVRIERFLNFKRSGKSYNTEVRRKKEYRNPDFLLHAVTYQDIDQIGSCFSKDVFDPHGYDKCDFYDALEADMRHGMERKEQERKKSQKVDFISGGTQPGTVIPTTKVNLPIPAANLHPAAADGGRDGRANKKSKWDKVDGAAKNSLSTGVQDSISAVLLSAANACSGYSAFAQQRRREAEDRRSERKLDKRS